MRCVLVLAFFLTTSSLASLSETVFKWKGFILTGIEFYQEWIQGPIKILGPKVGLNYTSLAAR